ncbi:hypothetical protein [Romboutsia sp.]|uniref:hypothetical protein n=1 Tax=Romboutsia sp. TaxID=1965302 RepID=UPI003F669506
MFLIGFACWRFSINAKIKINIMTEIKIKTVKELYKLKVLMEANNLDKPNFSELSR